MTKRLFEYPVSFFSTFFSSFRENHRAYLFRKLPLRIVVVAYGTLSLSLSSHRNDNFLSPISIVTISGYTEYYAIIPLLLLLLISENPSIRKISMNHNE